MYIWEKYRTFEITSGIILKMNLLLYKGFTLEITNKWWPLTTLNRWPLYRIKIYNKNTQGEHESDRYEQVTIIQRWPLRQVWLYFTFFFTWFFLDIFVIHSIIVVFYFVISQITFFLYYLFHIFFTFFFVFLFLFCCCVLFLDFSPRGNNFSRSKI